MIMWFKPEDLLAVPDNAQSSVLFRIKSSTKGFECYFKSFKLCYRILLEKYIPPSTLQIILIFRKRREKN